MIETLQSLSRQDLIILLSVGATIIIFFTIIITILCIYFCRRVNRSRGNKEYLYQIHFSFAMILVIWYNVDRHALITLDSCSNIHGSVDLDYIMKMQK